MFKPLHQASLDLPWTALIVTRTESVVIENRRDLRFYLSDSDCIKYPST